jgi:HEAT repeat protein
MATIKAGRPGWDGESEEAVTVLIAELGNELAFVRSLAAWHLGRLGPAFPGIEQAFVPLRRLMGDENPSVRGEAALALRTLGEGRPAAAAEVLVHLSLRRQRLARICSAPLAIL